ncbi:MAG: methyl-accepting chemotaxis protein [Bryobacteraceae bacterium]
MRTSFFHSVRGLRFVVAISFLIAILSGASSIYLIRRLATYNQRLTRIQAATLDAATLNAAGLQMGQATRNIVLDPANPAAHRNHAAAVKEFRTTLASLKAELETLFPASDATRACTSIHTDFEQHVKVQAAIHTLAKQGQLPTAIAQLNSADTPLWRKYKQTMQDSRAWLNTRATEVNTEIQQGYRTAQAFSWLCGLLLAASALTAFLISGFVGRRLAALAETLSSASDQIADASNRTSASSRSLAANATQQAASLQETAASTQQISAMANSNGQHSEQAATLVQQSQTQLSAVVQSLDQTVAAIDAIDTSSGKISRIIKTIDDIAFQTNILALNAAVEAARAGEAGMGFSVVAGEVGNLAHRCAQAARDTASLIEGSIALSHDGKTKVTQVAQNVRLLVASSGELKELVQEVRQGSHQQSEGVTQIAQAITQMDRSTQTAAAGAQQGAEAATDLAHQAEDLRDLVRSLHAAISGT